MRLRPSVLGQRGTTRGNERGACTMARPLSRPNASLPARRTMKFRLLFWMRGKRPRGIEAERRQHRLDFALEILARASCAAVGVQVVARE